MRVAVADDGGLFRDGLVMLLEASGHDVAVCVADGDSLLHALVTTPVEVVVLDIRMPPGAQGGLDTAGRLRERHPEVGILLLSQYAEAEYLVKMLDIGTERIGYRLKERIGNVAVLSDTLGRLAAGELVIEPALAARWVGSATAQRNDELAALTERETTVLRLMAEGRSNSNIADEMYVSVKAVEKYSAGIFSKLAIDSSGGSHHRRVLAVLAYLRATEESA